MRKLNLIYVTFIILFMQIFFVTALDLGTSAQGDCINLLASGTNITYGNISSITYPNGTYFLATDQYMTQLTQENKGLYNYTFCDTNQIGTWHYDTHTDPDGIDTPTTSSFSITPTGENPTIATAIFYIGLLVVLVIFFILILAYEIDADSIIGKTFSIGFGYLLIMAIFFIAWQMAAAFIYSSPFLLSFLRTGFIVLIAGFFPLILILFAYGIYMMLQIKEIKSMQERGISIDEINERKFGAAGRY